MYNRCTYNEIMALNIDIHYNIPAIDPDLKFIFGIF